MELPKGGTLCITLMDVPPQSVKDLGELLETVVDLVKMGDNTEADLTLKDPVEDCPFVVKSEKEKYKKERDSP